MNLTLPQTQSQWLSSRWEKTNRGYILGGEFLRTGDEGLGSQHHWQYLLWKTQPGKHTRWHEEKYSVVGAGVFGAGSETWGTEDQAFFFSSMIFIFSIIVDFPCSVNFYCTARWPSHTHIPSFSHVALHHVPSQVTRYSSLGWTAGSHCLSTPVSQKEKDQIWKGKPRAGLYFPW